MGLLIDPFLEAIVAGEHVLEVGEVHRDDGHLDVVDIRFTRATIPKFSSILWVTLARSSATSAIAFMFPAIPATTEAPGQIVSVIASTKEINSPNLGITKSP